MVRLCKEILRNGISAKEAFDKSMSIDLYEEVQRYCHIIDTERYNAYINDHIDDPQVSEDCWGKFAAFRQKFSPAVHICPGLSSRRDTPN